MGKFAILPALLAAVAAGSPARADFLLSVGAYQSPNFENDRGTAQFHVDGSTHLANPTYSISLGTSMPTTLFLDSSAGEGSMDPPSNSDPTTMFSGIATSTITLDGVTESIDDAYMFRVPPPFGFPITTPTFSGGTSVVFDLGESRVTVTTVASVGLREATFTLASAVPEPSSLLMLGVGLAGVLGGRHRARRRSSSGPPGGVVP